MNILVNSGYDHGGLHSARHMRNRTIICRLRKQKFDLEVVVVDEARVKTCQSHLNATCV